MSPATVAAVCVLAGLATALLARPVLRRLPEPAEPDGKPSYASLGSWGFLLSAGALSGAATAMAATALVPAQLPPWVVLAVLGVLLVCIDARTTWLPLPLTRVAWLAMAVAVSLTAIWTADPGVLVRAGVGAAAAGALYWAVWWLSRGGFGFGDVRFAPLLGAAASVHSVTLVCWTLVLGSMAGGLVGVARLLARRGGAFPYAPAMFAGAYAAMAVVVG